MQVSVLHLPLEVGNQVSEIVQALRSYGMHAVGLNWRAIQYIGYDPSIVSTDAFEMAADFEQMLNTFSIFHYHTGYSIFPDHSDILYALEAGKKVVVHHRGNDVRLPSIANKLNPYAYTGDSLPEEKIIENLRFFSQHLSTAIVQDFELYDYVKDYYEQVFILPRLINTKIYRPLDSKTRNDPPVVVHAPTSRAFKGTEAIIKIVHSLQKEIRFEFHLLEKMSKREVLRQMAQADIVIDQILCGAYGNVSVEAMALARPVICYMRQDILERMTMEPPIVSANPDTLYESLKQLLLDWELRYLLGKNGRIFVEKFHDSSVVGRQLLEIYRKL